MTVTDKTGALRRVQGARLELGCGASKRHADSIGIDVMDLPGVDLVGDVFDALAQIEDGVVAEIGSAHFFEHVADLDRAMAETARVLRPGGVMSVTVPHFSNPFFYSDPTHRAFFGLYSFAYLADSDLFRRTVPRYTSGHGYRLADVRLVFRSEGGGRLRLWQLANAAFNKAVNSSRQGQEVYEAKLSRIVSCYEITYTLVKL